MEMYGAARSGGHCPTKKIRFFEEIDGIIALGATRAKAVRRAKQGLPPRPNQEVRTYWCDACRGWHLTHLTIEEYEALEAERLRLREEKMRDATG